VPKLVRTGLGEINAIARAQAPDLAFNIRAIRREVPTLVDESVPQVNVDDACFFGVTPVKIVKIRHIGG
jgi:hypothetical protein